MCCSASTSMSYAVLALLTRSLFSLLHLYQIDSNIWQQQQQNGSRIEAAYVKASLLADACSCFAKPVAAHSRLCSNNHTGSHCRHALCSSTRSKPCSTQLRPHFEPRSTHMLDLGVFFQLRLQHIPVGLGAWGELPSLIKTASDLLQEETDMCGSRQVWVDDVGFSQVSWGRNAAARPHQSTC